MSYSMVKVDDHVKVTGAGPFAGKTGFVKSVSGMMALVSFDGDFAFEGHCHMLDLSPCLVPDGPRKDEE